MFSWENRLLIQDAVLRSQLCFKPACAHKRTKPKGQKKRSRQQFPQRLRDWSPVTPDSELEKDWSQKLSWLCQLFPTYEHSPCIFCPALCLETDPRDKRAAPSLPGFQVGLASERHHHEKKAGGQSWRNLSITFVWFPRTAITNYQRWDGLNQQKCILPQLWRTEVQNQGISGTCSMLLSYCWWSCHPWCSLARRCI